MAGTFADDPRLDREIRVWRFVHHTQYSQARGRASSAAFDDSAPEDPCSVLVREAAWTDDTVVPMFAGYGIAELTVGQIRDAGLGVCLDPTDEFANHARICGNKTGSRRKALVRAHRHVRAPA